MALLYVTEFSGMGAGSPAPQIAPAQALASYTVAIGGASAQGAVFGAGTKIVRVHADVSCAILFGSNPTALATSMRMGAGQTEYFAVEPGQRVAAISVA
jgi:hypothetical protein